jgi:hypothetical protein
MPVRLQRSLQHFWQGHAIGEYAELRLPERRNGEQAGAKEELAAWLLLREKDDTRV